MKWPIKVMWNKWGRYEQVRSFKTLQEATDWMDAHEDLKPELYYRHDIARLR